MMMTCGVAGRSEASAEVLGAGRAGNADWAIRQISDVIRGLDRRRPECSDGCDWASVEAALCALHNAIVALEEIGDRPSPRSPAGDRPSPSPC